EGIRIQRGAEGSGPTMRPATWRTPPRCQRQPGHGDDMAHAEQPPARRPLPHGRNIMTTLPPGPAQPASPAAPRAELAVFDSFPYLVTRVVPAMYHFTLLPGDASDRELTELARAHWRANRLDVCLVTAPDRAVFISAHGRERPETTPPMGGVPIAGRLRASKTWAATAELQARHQRLAAFIDRHAPKGGSMLGDLTKGGREANADDVARMAGANHEGVPRGL